MKLIIQIPCYNEAQSLRVVLSELPRSLEGFDKVEWLIIDDGSTDDTVNVALENGVDHIISLTNNKGLAKAFMAGVDACLKRGADIIVNTDADNQYSAKYIPKLIQPIVEGKADIVVGVRPIDDIRHFSFIKKVLQKLGSLTVRLASRTSIPDAPSGFRAISRDAALQLNVFDPYTYTLETLIQAGQKNMAITSVPVLVNEDLRPSRLVKSIPHYIKNSVFTIVRMFVIYKPFRFFFIAGLSLFFIGLAIGLKAYLAHGDLGHSHLMILSFILLGLGFQTMLVAFLADLLAVNRRLMEDVQYRLRKMENG